MNNETFCENAPDGTNTEVDFLQSNPITFDHPDGMRIVCMNGRVNIRYNPAENLGLTFDKMVPLTCAWTTRSAKN